jgi:hypothetical protein
MYILGNTCTLHAYTRIGIHTHQHIQMQWKLQAWKHDDAPTRPDTEMSFLLYEDLLILLKDTVTRSRSRSRNIYDKQWKLRCTRDFKEMRFSRLLAAVKYERETCELQAVTVYYETAQGSVRVWSPVCGDISVPLFVFVCVFVCVCERARVWLSLSFCVFLCHQL